MMTRLFAIGALLLTTGSAMAQDRPIPNFAGCTESRFVFNEAKTVLIGTRGTNYDPPCLRVHAGTKVIISAQKNHPLLGVDPIDGVPNPFLNDTDFITSQSRVLNDVGFIGYYCTSHGTPDGEGMAGLIEVVE